MRSYFTKLYSPVLILLSPVIYSAVLIVSGYNARKWYDNAAVGSTYFYTNPPVQYYVVLTLKCRLLLIQIQREAKNKSCNSYLNT
jgi:hypothetical protein